MREVIAVGTLVKFKINAKSTKFDFGCVASNDFDTENGIYLVGHKYTNPESKDIDDFIQVPYKDILCKHVIRLGDSSYISVVPLNYVLNYFVKGDPAIKSKDRYKEAFYSSMEPLLKGYLSNKITESDILEDIPNKCKEVLETIESTKLAIIKFCKESGL